MTSTLSIRLANEQDTEALLQIYATYVKETAITFEYAVPTKDEFASRIRQTLLRYPFLVILKDNSVCGYAYASIFKPRVAYDWSVETTIYLDSNSHGKGLGRKLYTALEHILKQQGIINANACITAVNLPYVTDTSESFHKKMGYQKNAHFTKCGFKFDRWFDMIWMEKFIGEHTSPPAPFIPFAHFSSDEINKQLAVL